MRQTLWIVLAVVMAWAVLTVASCGRGIPADTDRIVVSVGDSTLLLNEVLRQIPGGLTEEDSMAMEKSIVERWLRNQILLSVAERNIGNIDDIERMVEDYRAGLILNRYLSLMERGAEHPRDARRIEAYYREHQDSLLLEEPVVKGIFLKVNADDDALPSLRDWMKRADGQSVDNIESHGLRGAMQYEYFMDRWHPWHEVAELIPYRFFDADAFLESTSDFETEYGGYVYLVHISEYTPSGEKMPREYALSRIGDLLRQEDVTRHREKLMAEIYNRAIEDGRLKGGLYDPVTGRMSHGR